MRFCNVVYSCANYSSLQMVIITFSHASNQLAELDKHIVPLMLITKFLRAFGCSSMFDELWIYRKHWHHIGNDCMLDAVEILLCIVIVCTQMHLYYGNLYAGRTKTGCIAFCNKETVYNISSHIVKNGKLQLQSCSIAKTASCHVAYNKCSQANNVYAVQQVLENTYTYTASTRYLTTTCFMYG